MFCGVVDDNYSYYDIKRTNGMYCGVGGGVMLNKLQFELLYSVNRGSLVMGNGIFYFPKVYDKWDVEYSQITISCGYRF